MMTSTSENATQEEKAQFGALAQQFEQFCLLRSLECELRLEEGYEFINFMLTLQQQKDKLNEIGIINLIPVGSAVTKSIRRECFMVDVILNFNKAFLIPSGAEVEQIDEEQLQQSFGQMVLAIEQLFKE